MKLIIAGSRHFPVTRQEFFSFLDEELTHQDIDYLISGGARGIDTMAQEYALSRGIPFILHTAEWDKYGRGAGYRRNVDMANEGDALWAFIYNKSRGTSHMIDIAKERGLHVSVFEP